MPMEMTIYLGKEEAQEALIDALCAAGFQRSGGAAAGLGAIATADTTDVHEQAMVSERLGFVPLSSIRFIIQGEGPPDADRQILKLGARFLSDRVGDGAVSFGNGKVGLVSRDGAITVDENLEGAGSDIAVDLGRPVVSADLGTL